MTKLIRLNLGVFALYAVLSYFHTPTDGIALRFAHSCITLVASLALFGINTAAIIHIFRKKSSGFFETLSIASIVAIIVPPLILTMEHEQFGALHSWFPLMNSVIIFIALLSIHTFRKRNGNTVAEFEIHPKRSEASTFAIAASLYAIVIVGIFSAYYSLPDLDPYYWVNESSKAFTQEKIPEITAYRPLFLSLTYIFNRTAGVDLYAFFKYIIPLLAILITFPAALIAGRLASKPQKAIIFLFPFVNASGIIYLQLPIPQAVITVILSYFFFFLIYSWMTKDLFYHYLSGIVIFLTFFYHELAALPFSAWLAVTLVANAGIIKRTAFKNKLSSLLLVLLVLSNFSTVFKSLIAFLSLWMKQLFFAISALHPNLLFPARYINVDGISMGWEGLSGVMKYYAYYAGGVTPIILLATVYFFIRNKRFHAFILTESKRNPSLAVLMVNFLLFFSIAEVLPRLFSIALLPERAWAFAGIFSLAFLVVLFVFFNTKKVTFPSWLNAAITILFCINIGGAFYINELKRYIITQGQIESAEWIKANLPENRIIFASGNSNLLKFHAQSTALGVPSRSFYYDRAAYDQAVSAYRQTRPDILPQYEQYLTKLSDLVPKLNAKDAKTQKQEIASILQENIDSSKIILSTLSDSQEKLPQQNLYIYYSETDPRNPYADRPYMKTETSSNTDNTAAFVFDQQPDAFQRVYTDDTNRIIIWKIL